MLRVFHTSLVEIKNPDIYIGRKNADFGQGFYTTENFEFAKGWIKSDSSKKAIINEYEIDDSSLNIKRFVRNEEWFDYIFSNHRVKKDYLSEYDLIIGPIANDTIYNTMGIITSGFLSRQEALKLFLVGPEYTQVTIKTDKAVKKLKYISSTTIMEQDAQNNLTKFLKEEETYMSEIARVMNEFET